jgi:Uncharacterized alpha/beta hydrolase domain (DUF2235)
LAPVNLPLFQGVRVRGDKGWVSCSCMVTVAAYGLPFEELTKTFSNWLFPLQLASNLLPRQVERICHALALDEERTTFNPLLLKEQKNSRAEADNVGARSERINEVWFPGVHANVGGGYAKAEPSVRSNRIS